MAYTTKIKIFIVVFAIFSILACGIMTTYNRGGNMSRNGSIWLGEDGNVWVAGAQGVNSAGKWNDGTASYWAARGYDVQDRPKRTPVIPGVPHLDSNVAPSPPSTAPSAYSGGGTNSGGAAAAAEAAQRAARQAALNNTQKSIDSLGTELNVGYGNIDAEANAVRSRYQREAEGNEKDYSTQTVNNNQSLLKNKQNALQAAAQGARGLRSTLSSIGALGGTGQTLANRAVTNAANQDIGEASETAAGNARTLDTAIGKFRDEDRARRDELEVSARNNRTALEGRVESKRQGFLQKMAELFSELGDSGSATSYLNQAGDLNNTIASKTAVAQAPIAARGAAFTPGALADYLAGTGDMTVSAEAGDATGEGATPGTILAGRGKDERKRQTQVV